MTIAGADQLGGFWIGKQRVPTVCLSKYFQRKDLVLVVFPIAR